MPPRPESRPTEHLIGAGGAEPSRRLTLHRLWALLTGLTAIGGPAALLGGCGGGGGGDEGGGSGGVAADATPPTVSATSPPSAATGVALNSSVSATFSEAMTNATLNTASFTLVPTAGGAAVTGAVNVSGNTATFTPSASLAGSTQYTATITTAARDAAGNALAANFTWGFTTPTPSLGAHNLVFLRLFENVASLSTGPMNTQTLGSTILACVARGNILLHSLPTDNMGNAPYVQQDTTHSYTLWGASGTALYAIQSAAGGIGHVVTVDNPIPADEVTMAVVEVNNGGVIKQVRWNEVTLASGNPITSLPVTTTGPATLVAFWWGDADGTVPHDATPNNGFNLIDSLFLPGALVQCAVATKDVPAAGSYDVTWTTPPPTPPQGAQLWLVAVQSVP